MTARPLSRFIEDFFSRHLFERIICYAFLTELCVKVVFELVQGQWFYVQSQNKQYLFYGLIVMDYLATLPRLMHLKIRFNYIAVFLLVLLFIVAQGVFVGVVHHNRPFEIFNDTVPLMVLILNALRMQSYGENTQPVDFRRLLHFCGGVGAAICLSGELAVLLGLPSNSSVGGVTAGVYFPLFFAALLAGEKLSFRHIAMFAVIFVLSAINMNRTTMAFIVLVASTHILRTALRNPAKGMVLAILIIMAGGVGWSLLPEDSGTYKRIMALGSINFQETSGAIGERRSEMLSIERHLEKKGFTTELFGLGHGALYEVQATHEYIKDYGHAHYSWALFNLRYGMSGYVYLSFLALVLLYHIWRNWHMGGVLAFTVSLMCVQSFMYLGTYVNFVFLLAGLQFLYLPGTASPAASGQGSRLSSHFAPRMSGAR